MGRLLGYARVSSTDQDTALQIEQLWAHGCQKVWVEKKSGKAGVKREELEACIAAAKKGDIIVCSRIDRLARSVRDLWNLAQRLEDKKVGLKFIHQHIDTSRPEGRLFFTMLAAVAEFELDIRAIRVREGIERAKREGRYVGGNRKPGALKKAMRLKKAGYLPLDIIAKSGIIAKHLKNPEWFGEWPWTKQEPWMVAAMARYGERFFAELDRPDQPFRRVSTRNRKGPKPDKPRRMTPWLEERARRSQELSARQRERYWRWKDRQEQGEQSPPAA